MRVTEGSRRRGTWRKLAGIVAASVLALSVIGGGTAIAATPSWTMVVTPLPSTVKSGDVAGYRVVITNTGTSNISQVFLTNALVTTDPLIVPQVHADPVLTDPDPDQPLPIAYVATNQGHCDPVDIDAPIADVQLNCALGAIRATKSATVTVAYKTESEWTQTTLKVIFEANTTGVAGDSQGSSHGDVRQGVGSTALSNSPDFGGRFVTTGNEAVANGQALNSTNLQTTKVNSPNVGIPVTVADGSQVAVQLVCPVTCWSQTSEIHVDGGSFFTNGFKVEIQIYKDLSQTVHGVYHEFDTPHLDSNGQPTILGESITTKCPKTGTPSSGQIPCFSVTKLGGGSILVTVWLKENGKVGNY